MNLTRLAGNAPLKRQLELETARRGLSHAYILSGPAGSGKRTLAGLLAAAGAALARRSPFLLWTAAALLVCAAAPCIKRRRSVYASHKGR